MKNLAYNIYLLKHKADYFLGRRNRIYAKFWGIKLGKKSRFTGKCFFRKSKNSEIKIGNNFVCASKLKSNIIYRACSIITFGDSKLEIGSNVGISGGIIACFKNIKIGDNVRLGGNCVIMDGDFHLDDYRAGDPRPILIKDNAWIGMDVKVLKGVTIGENSIIGAGSIVVKDIPANVIAAGNPCKVIKHL